MSLKSEIYEQPDVLRRVLESQTGVSRQIAEAIRQRDIRFVFLVARGSSDNTGVYAKYLWGNVNRLPVALAAPSLFTMYDQPPRLRDALVLGISQSGRSPDVVSVLAEGQRQGALTVALTNDSHSPMAAAADYVLNLSAGEEKAIAATKTYTASLMALAMLSAHLDGSAETLETLAHVPDAMQQALELDSAIERGVRSLPDMTRCVVLGRGFNYGTACEWALKLKELAYVVAEPYSPADFRHGPIAMVEPGFPILAIAPGGKVFADMLDLLRTLAEKHSSDLAIISDQDQALSFARLALKLPGGIPEWATPLFWIVPAQLFCYHVTRAKGLDPDAPRGLMKVTETR